LKLGLVLVNQLFRFIQPYQISSADSIDPQNRKNSTV